MTQIVREVTGLLEDRLGAVFQMQKRMEQVIQAVGLSLGGAKQPGPRKGRRFSAAHRAKLAAAQRRRWARVHKNKGASAAS